MKLLLLILLLHTTIFSYNISDVNDYIIYYGRPNEKILKELSNYDLVIIETILYTDEMLEFLKDSNTIVLGYMSVMEVGYWDSEFIEALDYTDYMHKRLFRVKSGNNYVGDIYDRSYRNKLYEIIKSRIIARDIDGIFLDTVDWIDYYKDERRKFKRLVRGYRRLLEKIRSKTNDNYIIMQNRAFYTLDEMEGINIDILLWENFNVFHNDFHEREKVLEEYEDSISYFTTFKSNEKINTQESLKRSWIPFYHNASYGEWGGER